ncbi:MAG: PrsW family intramembrane metalloprotease [Oscillospiraceae bacterium]|nr:PrsW family intramembrane metalloprotease [Oscillospiraceae bacterium]
MIFILFVEIAVCLIILRWLLKKKKGDKYSVGEVLKFIILGILPAIFIAYVGPMFNPPSLNKINSFAAGAFRAFVTAGLLEEIPKYVCFRLAILGNKATKTWLDAIIAAVIVGIGFTMIEDVRYGLAGDRNLLRALVPGHLLFQALMGYYYGKARVTGKKKYDMLSVSVPVLWHAGYDLFIMIMVSMVKAVSPNGGMDVYAIENSPYFKYVIPLICCFAAVALITVIAMIIFARKISVWSRTGEKQESLG